MSCRKKSSALEARFASLWDALGGVPLRILTVDVQRDSFYVVVRSWVMNGSSRLMHCAHVLTWDDIINIQMQFGVHANLCFIDCVYSSYEVYSHSADNGWTALMGDKRNTFTHRRNNAKPVERFYLPKQQINLGYTKTGLKVCDMFFWSNLNVKYALNRLRRNEEAPHRKCLATLRKNTWICSTLGTARWITDAGYGSKSAPAPIITLTAKP